ncbi:DMT family transporter [Marinomonas mediterranea]|uniref:DMT family transporter n=1 Tax=Marinomonas mediterranea TaxID=119864 RepID=UPI002349FD2A|nr:DMT family transporter [Marinomonas mediterranea]WCN08829.1 EamA family transporter [Marinomonas mediterranea]WCN12874.1 EamA family transporter [Marinomonas mediterranea]
METLNTSNRGYLYGMVAVIIWVGFILVSRAGSLSALGAADMITIRFGTAFILLLPFIVKYRARLFTPKMFVLGGTGGVAYGFSAFSGFEYAPATHAALLLPGLMPIVIAVMAYLLAGERHSHQVKLGILLSSIGIGALLIETLISSTATLKGDMYFVLACFFWGLMTVLLKRWKVPAFEMMLAIVATTCVMYVPVYLLFLPKALDQVSTSMLVSQAIYQGFLAMAIQMVCFGKAVQMIGATKMGALMALVPVFASILAIPLFGESVTVGLIIALVSILLGTFVGNLPRRWWVSKVAVVA